MYSKTVTEQQLKHALPNVKTQWQKASGRSNFEFKYHTPSEAQQIVEMFNALIDSDGNAKRPLTLEEHRIAINERNICRWDARYYWSRYYKIEHWSGSGMVLFEPNIAQNIILDTWAEREEKKLDIMQIHLKARQIGDTTLWQGAIAHRVHFHSDTHAVVGSSRPEKSAAMIDKALKAWNHVPWFLRPRPTQYKAGELIKFGLQNSSINIQHGAKVKAGIARGETIKIGHFSECCEYLNPSEDIDSAVLFAIHPNPETLFGLESTAKGQNNWWHYRWMQARDNWGVHPTILQPVFIPWYIARDLYPTATWLLGNPIPSDWKPSSRTERHAAKAIEYVQGTPLLNKYLGSTWNMPPEQQWYWESTRAEYQRMGELNKFYSELCADDVEAFQHEGTSVFDAELIMKYNELARRPITVYGIDSSTADEIRDELRPDVRQIQTNAKPMKIDAQREGGKTTYTLVPLRLDGYPVQFNPTGKLLIWEMPQDGVEYGIGIDTAQGLGLDRSVCEVIRKATLTQVARQVAEFSSEWVSASDLFPYAHCLAKLYSRKDSEGNLKQPKIIVETNNGGDACQLALRKAGWGNLHSWMRYDKKIIDGSKANFLGAVTTTWSRDLVLGHLIKALRDGLIDIDSKWFVTEMQTLVKDPDRAKIAATLGAHDDRFMAMGWIYLSMHILEFGEVRSAFGKGRILDDAELPKPAATKPPSPEELPVAADFVADRMIQHQHSAVPNWWPGDGMDSSW
jgi:hypothetical protein